MSAPDPIDRDGLRDRFWERIPLEGLSRKEWEALCDGCGLCCLNKLEDAETGEVAYTRIACRLLDDEACRCSQYDIRRRLVPDCVVLTPANIEEVAHWMPRTCAYRLILEGRPLHDWHPLVSGTPETVHQAGVSVRGWAVPEWEVGVEDWEDHVISDA